jgi:hypothetical protein
MLSKKTRTLALLPALLSGGVLIAVVDANALRAQTAIKPTVMVMPSTMFMKERGFCTTVEIDGRPRDQCDYNKLLAEDKTFAMIVATVATQFQERGYPIRSLEASLATLAREDAQRMTSGKVETTMTDRLLLTGAPDIAINIKSEVTTTMGQQKLNLILDGVDVYVDEQVATKSLVSNPSGSLSIAELAKGVTIAIMPEIESKLMAHFQRMGAEGRRVKLRVEIAAGAGLADGMDTEVTVDGTALPLNIYATMLAEKMAYNRQYQPGPSGDAFVAFNSFNIPFGETPRLFLFKMVQQFKKDTGLNAKASNGAGLGDLLILIDKST